MESNEKELKLLLDVENGNLHLVAELIKNGVNVNFQDSEGNTALHYAVRYGQFFIVKLLLQESADINAENANFETPMDFVTDENSPNAECIAMALQRHVVEKSFNILETFLDEEASDDETSSDSDSVTTERVFNRVSVTTEEVPNNDFKGELKKDLFKNGDRIKSFLTLIKDLDTEAQSNEFTYKQANTFIYFLHIFSFRSLEIVESGPKTENETSNSFHGLRYNLRIIRKVQNLLIHSSDKTFNLRDIGKIKCFGVSISSFFKGLMEYVEGICTLLDGSDTICCNIVDIATIMKVPFKAIGEKGVDVLLEEWKTFMLVIYKEDQLTEELSHKILFNFLVNFSPAIEEAVPNFKKFRKEILNEFPNIEFKEKFRDIFHYNYDSYFEFTAFLISKNAKLTRITNRLAFFKKLYKNMNGECEEFTYELANSFNFLLDSLIFESNKVYFVNGIEAYFARCYPQFKTDQSLICGVINILCHNTNKKISLADVGKVINSGTSLVNFCQKLVEYVEYVCTLLSDSDAKEVVDIASFLQVNDDIVGTQTDDKLIDEIFYLVQLVQKQDEWTKEKTEEIIFSLLYNISQADKNNVCKINSLVSLLKSNIYSYLEIVEVLKVECTRAVFKLRSRMFKHSCAKRVHEILHKVSPNEGSVEIGNMDLSCAFKNIELYDKKTYQEEYDGKNGKIASSIDSGFFNLSLLPSCEDLTIKDLVKQCFKYMIVIKDNLLDSISSNYCRFVLEHFQTLKLVKSSYPELYSMNKNRIKQNLATMFKGLLRTDSDYFDKLCKIYIENDDYQNDNNEKEIAKIIDGINNLRRIQTDLKITDQDFLSILAVFGEEGEKFAFDKHPHLLRNYDIKGDKQQELQMKLKEHCKDNFIESTLEKTKLSLDAKVFLHNILATFYSMHYSYKIKFDGVKDAFNDELCFQNILWLEKKYWEENFKEKQNFGKYLLNLFTVIEQIFELKLKSSYVTKFIIDEVLVNSLDKEDLGKLTEALLEESCIDTLVDLLDVTKEDDGLYDIISMKISGMNLGHLRPIFEDSKHAKILFKHFEKLVKESSDCDRVTKLEVDVLKLINNLVYKLFCRNKLVKALELVEICLGTETEFKKLEVINTKRLKAIIFYRQGDLLKQQNLKSEANEKFESALHMSLELKSVMEETQNNSFEHNAMFLLILVTIATIYYYWDKNSEAHEAYCEVYNCIKNFVLYNLPAYSASLKQKEETEEEFFDIIKSKKYYDLCHYTIDSLGQFDLVNIRTLMASRLIRIRWKEHNDSVIPKELKLYADTLSTFTRLYKMLKLNELSHYQCELGNLAWRIGYMHINLYRVKMVINSYSYRKEIVRHMVKALLFNHLRVHVQEENSDDSKGLETIFLTLHDLAKYENFNSWVNDAMKRRLNTIKELMVKTLDIQSYVTYYRNIEQT